MFSKYSEAHAGYFVEKNQFLALSIKYENNRVIV